MELWTYSFWLWIWIALAPIVMVAVFFVSAPYGRHQRAGWGPVMPAWVGWIVMESPALLVFLAYFLISKQAVTVAAVILLLLWVVHYGNRVLVYPFRIRSRSSVTPVAVVCMAFVFCSVNAYFNGRWVFGLSGGYGDEWLTDPRFLVGITVFWLGFRINQSADQTLLSLRGKGDTGYKIPEGGLYRYVSCPNYLGEILEWCGWAVATWSLAGASFAAWTIANLLPRALDNHRWYKETFEDYPAERKALIPYIL
jgi:3-oxo-5-alpha-steroid 4-dehydrogenase 1